MDGPALSVFMPVHQAARYLERSVRSVLDQSFGDFELVALVNGSRDASAQILRRIAAQDARLVVHEVPTALGTGGAAHEAIRRTRAPILARMDADDISHPRRLERQLATLRGDPGAVAVSSLTVIVDSDGRIVRRRNRTGLTRAAAAPPFVPASVMMRRAAYEATGGYRAELSPVDDMDLLQRIATLGRFLVLPEALYVTRFHPASATASLPPRLAARRRLDRERFTADRTGRPHPSPEAAGARGIYEREILRFWGGERPHVFRELRRARLLRPTPTVIGAVTKGFAGWTWPSGARAALSRQLVLRDWWAGRRMTDEARQWHLP